MLAGALTRNNATLVSSSIGRQPTNGELYIAHFLGADSAGKLINGASKNPRTSAASMFPHAAAADRTIFYDTSGRARSVGEVYGKLTRLFDSARDVAVAQRGGLDTQGVAPSSLAPPLPAPVSVGVAPVKSVPGERPMRTASVSPPPPVPPASIPTRPAAISTTRYGRRYAGLRAGRGEAATAASGTAVVSVDVHGSGQSASGGKGEHPVGGTNERAAIPKSGGEGV
jgi:hypothetical protein